MIRLETKRPVVVDTSHQLISYLVQLSFPLVCHV